MSSIAVVLCFATATAAAGRSEETFFRLVVALVAILAMARVMVVVVRRIGQTDVIGEVLAGLLLGPSLLGWVVPGAPGDLFPDELIPILGAVSSLGLVFLMFQLGQEFEFKSNLGASRRAVWIISVAGTAFPFALGYAAAPWFLARIDDAGAIPADGFRLFFAISMSITAIPVLGRIFMELGVTRTRAATLAISCAAVDDVTGWLLLGGVSLMVTASFTWGWALQSLAALVVFLAVVFFVARPLLSRYVAAHMRRHGQLRHTAIGVMLVAAFVAAGATSKIGVHALLGGFALGIALHDQKRFVAEWKMRVAPLVNTFFLPIFFTFTGLRTNVAAIAGWHDVLLCLGALVIAIIGKLGGCYVAARLAGETNRNALILGVCMNTRGLVELVVLNVGFELGLIPQSVFTMLVIMAVVTTMMATPLIRFLLRAERTAGAERDLARATIALDLPASASWAHRQSARHGVREMLEGLLADRPAANGVSDDVNQLLDAVMAASASSMGTLGLPAHPPSSPRLRLDLDGGRVVARISAEVGPGAASVAAELRRRLAAGESASSSSSFSSSSSSSSSPSSSFSSASSSSSSPSSSPTPSTPSRSLESSTSAAASMDEAAARLAELGSKDGYRLTIGADGFVLFVESEFLVRIDQPATTVGKK